MPSDVDVTFDFRSDTPEGKDPDTHSETLRRYHKLLWSKQLPRGDLFDLDDTTPRAYLHHRSAIGEFWLASDAAIPTFRWNDRVKSLISIGEWAAFDAVRYTMGGMIVFPGNTIDGKWTINQARGCTRAIADRFDLTMECIRRHYSGDLSPLSGVLARYASFFDLFRDFRGYVNYFLLQDIVVPDCSAVRISSPFDDFRRSPIPATLEEYRAYKDAAIAFIEARNRRILESVRSAARGGRAADDVRAIGARRDQGAS